MGYEQPVLQRRLCTNSPSAHLQQRVWGDTTNPLAVWCPSHHLHYLSSKKILIFKVVCQHRSCIHNGSAAWEFGVDLHRRPQTIASPFSSAPFSKTGSWVHLPKSFFFCFYFALILFSLDKPSFFIHGQVVLTQPQLLRGVLMMFFHRVLRWIQYLGDMSWWETQWNWGNSSIWGTLKCVIPFLTELPKYYWFYYPHIFDSKKFKALLYFPQIRFISSMTELIN